MMASFKENDIRPDRLKQAQTACIDADIAWFNRHREQFVHTPCPACACDQPRHAFEKNGMTYVFCAACETMYVTPRPSAAMLSEFYAESQNYAYWNEHIFPASEDVRREKIFKPRAERVAELCHRHGCRTCHLVEVGSGFGIFCEEISRLNVFDRITAIEPTPDLAATCRRKGVAVVESPVEDVTFPPGDVDIVAAFEVIEHLFSPREFFEKCASILDAGGLVVVTCPNVKGFDIVSLGRHSESVDHEHLNYFHPAALSALAHACGFDTLEVSTPGRLDAELVRKKALSGDLDLSSQPFIRQILVDEWDRVGEPFQQFLAGNQLSTHMWLVARKRADSQRMSRALGRT